MEEGIFGKDEFVIFAHRGAGGREPENTLRAITKALDFGARWVEVDVHVVEGELIVIHDDRLERTTNGTGRVMERSLSDLRSLDAGKGERIPLLREVFDCVEGKAGINVELKGSETAAPLADFLKEDPGNLPWFRNHLLVSSMDHAALQRFHILAPSVAVGLLFRGPVRDPIGSASIVGAVSLHLHRNFVDADLVARAHRQGLKVFVFTVNRTDEMERLRSLGADGIFTDFPDCFREGSA
ncbi:MAG: glycerophosphodiester phosphodiesterase [Deltaproteobacteria bacterium]|nr:glycerophosphodiester phosphodiesterase [Deltaproteobacteria bacterium]